MVLLISMMSQILDKSKNYAIPDDQLFLLLRAIFVIKRNYLRKAFEKIDPSFQPKVTLDFFKFVSYHFR